MSVAFYSDESESINRKISSEDYDETQINYVDINFEIDKCVEWINKNNFSKVALQFPDSLLKDAVSVASKIEEKTKKQFFILGDTTYGSCCVDEISAQHVSASAIIHFGHACLSPTNRYPVLFVFGMSSLDVQNFTDEFRKLFPDVTSHVILYYEVFYYYIIDQIAENLKEYQNLVISELEIPQTECTTIINDEQTKIIKCQRRIVIPKSKQLEDYCILYIGSRCQTLKNVRLSFNNSKFYTYDPMKKVSRLETFDVNKFLRKRYYYIEKTRDAAIIGILVGTLGVSDYLTIIRHLRNLIQAAGKKVYTLVVGKVNVAKLANFAEIEVFVSVSCAEFCVIDCSEFYQPIITPYELEIALNPAREWTGNFIADFCDLLPGTAMYLNPNDVKDLETDVSLVTGKLRSSMLLNPFSQENSSDALVARDPFTISALHSQAAGEYLNQRSWKGLEQCLGETSVADIQQGKKGIACQYDNEEQNKN